MKTIKIILLLILISPSTYATQSERTKEQHSFEEYLKKEKPDNVVINTSNLAKCSAQLYAFSLQSQDYNSDFINRIKPGSITRIKLISEYLYILAIKRNKIIASNVYNSEKEMYLRRITDNKLLDIPRSNQILCAKVILKSKKELEKYLQNSTQNVSNTNMHGIWIDYYAKWERYLSTRDYARNVEVVNFERDGNATLVFGGLYKTSKNVIFDFTSLYIVAKGKWAIKNNEIIAEFKVIKNNSIKYKKIPPNTILKYSYSLVGKRLFTGENVLTKLETSKYPFIDKVKLFSVATENEKKEADRILYILEKDNEITGIILRGDRELSEEEKEISNIDIDKEFLDFTEDEIKERDKNSFFKNN